MSTHTDSTPAAPAEAPDKGVGCDALLAVLDNLEGLAERWEATPVWHEPLFRDGRININTGDLHDIAVLLRWAQETRKTLADYLALSSIDGRVERQPLRAKLKSLSSANDKVEPALARQRILAPCGPNLLPSLDGPPKPLGFAASDGSNDWFGRNARTRVRRLLLAATPSLTILLLRL